MADLMFRTVDELASMVSSGEVSARELVQESLDRIAELDPQLNAFIDVYAEEALAEADGVGSSDERPYAGVPIAIKGNRAIEGKRFTYASDFMGDYVPSYSHNIVRRLRAAGFIVVGSTTIPEYGILPWTNTRRFGPTRNPWDPTRVSGGSSGGSATAVASGMVPIASANDGGGSTRIPAAACGLVGLKPQRNRISFSPELGDSFLGIDGVLTRTVAETASLLDILAGYEPGDANWAPPPAEPFAAAAAREPSGLRIAFTLSAPLDGAEVDPAQAEAVRETAALLESLGHHVEETDPPWKIGEVLPMFTAVFAPMVCLQIMHAQLVHQREPRAEDVEPISWALWERSRKYNAVEAHGAVTQLQGLGRAIISWMEPYDAILTPSLALRPPALDDVGWDTDDPMGLFTYSGHFTPFTAIANVSGQPAVSLPTHHGDDGLPIGSQLFGKPAQEGALLGLSRQIEAALPWAGRRAPQPSAAA